MNGFIIKNVRILDGTGMPWFRGSVAVKDGRIAWIGPTDEILPSAKSTQHINQSGCG